MKKLTLLLFLMTPLIMTSPLYAVTNPFSENGSTTMIEHAIYRVGTKLSLFQSSMVEVILNPPTRQEIGRPEFPDTKWERIRSDKLNPPLRKQLFFIC